MNIRLGYRLSSSKDRLSLRTISFFKMALKDNYVTTYASVADSLLLFEAAALGEWSLQLLFVCP